MCVCMGVVPEYVCSCVDGFVDKFVHSEEREIPKWCMLCIKNICFCGFVVYLEHIDSEKVVSILCVYFDLIY